VIHGNRLLFLGIILVVGSNWATGRLIQILNFILNSRSGKYQKLVRKHELAN
jgi:hypothetical protein